MNRYRLIMIGAILIFAFTTHAQQTKTNANAPAKGVSPSEDSGLPSVDAQLAVLTEKLNLSDDQQKRIRPILRELHEATEKLFQDKTLSQEERLAKVRPQRYKADSQIRAFLSDDQKKKLDQYLQGPHPEMHGNLTGTTTPPRQPNN